MYEPAFVRAGDCATADSLPPLYLPAILGQTDAAAHLLAHGAEIDGADRRGVTALHGAAAHGQVPMIQWLLDHGATIDAASPACGTPLHLAVWEGQEAAVRCLLHRGAAAQMPTCDGQLPQELAAVRGHQHLAELLAAFIPTDNHPEWTGPIGRGAEAARAYFLRHPDQLNSARHHGHSPLGWAAHLGDRETVSTLLEMGAELTPEAAIIMGRQDYVRQWVADHPLCINVRRVEGRRYPLLYFAAIRGDAEIAALLLDHGANVNGDHKNGETALHGAVAFAQTAMVQFLIERGANVNAATKWGITPLHRAAATGQLLIAQTLVAHGADPRAVTADGESVLESALLNGHKALADWLMPFVS